MRAKLDQKSHNETKMKEKTPIFSTKTLIPVGTVVGVVGAIVWVTTMYNDISYLRRDIVDTNVALAEVKAELAAQIDQTKDDILSQTSEKITNVATQVTEVKTDVKEIKQILIEKN